MTTNPHIPQYLLTSSRTTRVGPGVALSACVPCPLTFLIIIYLALTTRIKTGCCISLPRKEPRQPPNRLHHRPHRSPAHETSSRHARRMASLESLFTDLGIATPQRQDIEFVTHPSQTHKKGKNHEARPTLPRLTIQRASSSSASWVGPYGESEPQALPSALQGHPDPYGDLEDLGRAPKSRVSTIHSGI